MAQTPTQSNAASTAPARIALVTGAARRVGRVIALALARHGWDVAVHCHRSRAEADAVAAEITAMGRRAAVLQADLSDEVAAGRLIGDCIAALGTPTCLVNNASLFQYDVATSFSYASLDTHMRTNVAAPLLLSRELHRALVAEQPDSTAVRGVVINLLDQKLDNLNPDFLSYTLSKAALSTATMQLAQALAPALRVVGVAPGITMVSGARWVCARASDDAAGPVVHAGRHCRGGVLPRHRTCRDRHHAVRRRRPAPDAAGPRRDVPH
jgi:NAD(P)-dependent dehydrogenase (short-subunit alcohol dehydrogenase family)